MSDKTYHHGNLREALIEAGIELINREGAKQLSLRAVAAHCNVSHAAPYSHFKGKKELLEAMQQHVASRFTALFENILQANDRNNPGIIDELGVAYISFFIDNPQYFSFLFSRGSMKIDLSLRGGGKESFPAFQIFKDTATHIYQSLGLPQAQIQNIIIVKWSVVHGLASIATMEGVYYDKDWKSQIRELLCLES